VAERDDESRRRHLVLVGMMGAGKSTIGRATAERLGWPYVDNDELVRELSGTAAPAIAASRGVDELHRLEVEALFEVLRRPGPLVAGAAGFAVTDPAAVRLLRDRATVCWLRARPATLRARIGDGAGRRDDARSDAWLERTAAEREPAFAAVADLVLDVDARSVDDLAADLASRLGGPR
jgi:shikimate kinase